MLSNLIKSSSARFPDRLFVSDYSSSYTYKTGYEKVVSVAGWFCRRKVKRAYFWASDSADLLLALVACDLAGVDACVLNYQLRIVDVKHLLEALGDGLLITNEPADIDADQACLKELFSEPANSALSFLPADRMGKVIILTTGTTGIPKAAVYTWQVLLDQVRSSLSAEPRTWLLAYPLNHFAGYQVLSHALLQGDSIVIPASRSWVDVMVALKSGAVNSISATPTFWRFLIGHVPPNEWSGVNIKRITLGGEVVTEEILTKLKALFPGVAITHVYATTELGACFSVKDGKPGFPGDYLRRAVGNVELKIIDGELFARSKNGMLAYLDPACQLRSVEGWIATGDLVELQDDRVYFRGRVSEVINVGGAKAHPAKVENLVLGVSGVLAARAYGHPNPVTGQVVAVEVEIMDGGDEQKIREEINQTCRANLGRHELPRIINIVPSIARLNEKIVRRNVV